MGWWLSSSAATLRAQVDRRWPHRDKASDGTVGDAAHASRASDHNPAPTSHPAGCVRAIDLDTDLGQPGDMQRLANQLVLCARDRRDGGRLSYVIFDGRIASGTDPAAFWTWRPYDGADPHTGHAHVSFTPAGDHVEREFDLPIFTEPQRRFLRRRLTRLNRRIRRLFRLRRRTRRQLDDLTP